MEARTKKLSEIKENCRNKKLLKELAENFNWAVVMTDEDPDFNWAPVAASLSKAYAVGALKAAPEDYILVELN